VGKPGTTVTGIISVSSSRPEETQIRATLGDFTRNIDGLLREATAAEVPRSSRTWMDIDQREFVAGREGSIPLVVTIRIPEDAAGSYWALVSLEALPSGAGIDRRRTTAVGVAVVPRIAVPVVVTVAGTEQVAVSIQEVHVAKAESGSALDCVALVENTGTTAVLLSGAFTVERQDEELASVDVGMVTSLPGTKVRVKATIPWQGESKDAGVHAYLRYGSGPTDSLEASTPLTSLRKPQ
jgi:hypothetical protein